MILDWDSFGMRTQFSLSQSQQCGYITIGVAKYKAHQKYPPRSLSIIHVINRLRNGLRHILVRNDRHISRIIVMSMIEDGISQMTYWMSQSMILSRRVVLRL